MAFPLLRGEMGLCVLSVFVTPTSMRVMGSALRRTMNHGRAEGGVAELRDHGHLHTRKNIEQKGKLTGQ